MKESIARVLDDAASVRAMSDDMVLDIRDIDSIATEQEICAAIASQFDIDGERIRVRSLRRGYAESQSTVISLPYSLGKAVLHRGEVPIGWTICRIRERTGPPRCFKCLEPGHIALKLQKPSLNLLCGRKEGDQAPVRKHIPQLAGQGDLDRHAVDPAEPEPLQGRAGRHRLIVREQLLIP